MVLGHNSRLKPFFSVRSKWKRENYLFCWRYFNPSPVFYQLRFIWNTFSRRSCFVSTITNIGRRNKTKNNSSIVSVCKPSSNRLYISLLSIYVVFFLYIGDGLNEKNVTPPFRKVDFEWLITLRWRKFVWKKELFKIDKR